MVDASALLWRLKLRGVDLGDRWTAIADRWQPLIEDKLYAFNDCHAVMALLGAGRIGEAERTVSIMTETARKQSDNAAMSRDVGLPLARALLAFEHGKYAATIDLLRPLAQHRPALRRQPRAARPDRSHLDRGGAVAPAKPAWCGRWPTNGWRSSPRARLPAATAIRAPSRQRNDLSANP